ncbi:thioredoxin [Roseimarinus sediminis]|uniref:thioredoxin n=1 Tax=Roseimarinus sediminis TaxID=1610899 RepID=UPI003D1A155C
MLYTNLKHIETEQVHQDIINEHSKVIIICGRMGTYSIPVYRIAEQLQVFYPEVKFFDMEYDNPESAFLCELAGAGAPLQLPLIFYYQNGLMIHHTAGNQSSEQITSLIESLFELQPVSNSMAKV